MLGMIFSQLGLSAELQTGEPAPGFELTDQNNKSHALKDYRNSWLVLYFYPKDDTPGCTTEACNFRDDYLHYKKMGVTVLGVSIDNNQSHAEFAEKYHLPFPLLADNQGQVAKQYNAFFSMGPLKFAKRHSFIIDPQGKVAKIYRKVNPETHSQEIISDLKKLINSGSR